MSRSRETIQQLAARVRETLLLAHVGAGAGIACDALARHVQASERDVRLAVTALREAGVAVCGQPRTGYFIAETAEELDATCRFLRERSLHGLHLEACLRKLPLPDLVGQLRLDLTENGNG